MKLTQLAMAVPINVVRDGDFNSLGLLSLRSPAMLACLYEAKARHECRTNTDLACVITTPELAASVPEHLGLALADAPRERFHDAHRHLGEATDFYGVDAPTEISSEAQVHSAAFVSPRNVRIGPGCVIEPGAIVLERSTLEAGVIIRSGAVIGAEGFHPINNEGGVVSLPHYGAVRLGRAVEVQSKAVVCRAVFNNPTEIEAETLLGPMVYIAHGVRIGNRCRIAASARVAGSSTIGNRVYIGPNAVISNQVRIGNEARVSIGAVVVRNVPANHTVSGHFAVEHGRFLAVWSRWFR
jgi:UDP-3-O-[3-hydroxymyristoyl] glucosamine N-acyltransferase